MILLSLALVVSLIVVIYQSYTIQHLKKPPQHEVTHVAHHTVISQQRHLIDLLNETSDFHTAIINSLPVSLVCVTPEGDITHWNLAAKIAADQAHDDALGHAFTDVYPNLPITQALIQSTVDSGVPYLKENVQLGTGRQATFVDLNIFPLASQDIPGAVILAEDVTPRVRVEHMMIQNEKMRGLGEMAAGVAHEINNPLAGVLNNAQNILRRISPNLEANKQAAAQIGIELKHVYEYLREREIITFIESIRDSGERAAHIVTNMLEFSRSNHTHHEFADIPELIQQSLELTSKSLELKTSLGIEMPKVTIDYTPPLAQVCCSKIEIQQVFMNLIRNAAQAFQSDEYGAPLDPEVIIRIHQEKRDMIIEIEDNGPGMPESVRAHIFEPFFTTKDVGKGTGLGLSVTYFIITEHHKGTITVDSRPGEGTSFVIHLPIGEGTGTH